MTERTDSQRRVSITFDDGLQHGTDVACKILGRYALPATFYVVTGWVEPLKTTIREPLNAGRSHGNWDYWRQVHRLGHEVGSHTFSHINADGKKARLLPWLTRQELEWSQRDLSREVPQRSVSLSMPWNAATARSEYHARRLFAGCRLGTSQIAYNTRSRFERYRLASWAPDADTLWPEYERAIRQIPEGGWLILQYHSFDDEGWQPVPREIFERLCRTLADDSSLSVQTVADALESYS